MAEDQEQQLPEEIQSKFSEFTTLLEGNDLDDFKTSTEQFKGYAEQDSPTKLTDSLQLLESLVQICRFTQAKELMIRIIKRFKDIKDMGAQTRGTTLQKHSKKHLQGNLNLTIRLRGAIYLAFAALASTTADTKKLDFQIECMRDIGNVVLRLKPDGPLATGLRILLIKLMECLLEKIETIVNLTEDENKTMLDLIDKAYYEVDETN